MWVGVGVSLTHPFSCFRQKPLGEQFRKEVHIKNLPWLFKKSKPMLETEVLDSEEGGLATIFEP